jgi:hypothetical protein
VSWKKRETLGEQIVADAFDVLQPPVEWLLNQPDGFTWWPGEMAQRVWTDQGIFRNSRTYYRLHCETDLVRAGKHKQDLDGILEKLMDDCAFSSLIYEKRSDTYKLHASIYAEADIAGWITGLFQTAARLQLADAYRIVDKVTELLHPSHAVTTHPTSGVREERDPRINDALGPLIASGARESAWCGVDEWRDVDWAMERQAQKWAKSDRKQSISTFYWAACPNDEIKLHISCEEPHSLFGNGLHFTITVPLKMSAQHVAYMALELNQHERDNWLKTQMLGSWCNHDGTLAFRLFVPNACYMEGVLHELSVTMASRAVWTNEFFWAKKQAAEAAKQPSVQ